MVAQEYEEFRRYLEAARRYQEKATAHDAAALALNAAHLAQIMARREMDDARTAMLVAVEGKS